MVRSKGRQTNVREVRSALANAKYIQHRLVRRVTTNAIGLGGLDPWPS